MNLPSKATAILLGAGLCLTLGSTLLLRSRGELRHNQNPFAIQRSGYGMILARLSQDTVNKVWHYGIEQVNPEHAHPAAEEDHDDHDHHHHDHHAHDHGDHHDCDHAGCRTVRKSTGSPFRLALEGLEALKGSKFARTNPRGLTDAHQAKVAQDIEKLLLRSYRMDPTDYGVYNAYSLFLTIHEFRATPASREHANLIADITVAEAAREVETPFPWLTAASALLDQFFLAQQDARAASAPLSLERVREFDERIQYCLAQYEQLKGRAIFEKRWERIGGARRQEAEERFRFITAAAEQFDTLLSGGPASTATGRSGS